MHRRYTRYLSPEEKEEEAHAQAFATERGREMRSRASSASAERGNQTKRNKRVPITLPKVGGWSAQQHGEAIFADPMALHPTGDRWKQPR